MTSRSEREHPRRQVYATASPFDAAVEQEPEAVVLEVAEAVADPFDLFDQQVHGFGWSVGQAGAVPAQDLGFPAAHRRGEAAELDDVGCAAMGVEALEPPASPPLRSRGVDLAEHLLSVNRPGAGVRGRSTNG